MFGRGREAKMMHLLLIDDDPKHAEDLTAALQARGNLDVQATLSSEEAIDQIRRRAHTYDLVVLNVSDASKPWPSILIRLQGACRFSGHTRGPLFICVSSVRREPQFELSLERKGARYVQER